MIIGIDFGTSTSEVAFVSEDGTVTLIPNHLGELITPSVVYIDENGTPVIGREAKERALIEPESTILEVKRLLGQNVTLLVRGKSYSPVEVATFIIRYLAECAAKHTGAIIDAAVITVPAYFTDAQRKEVIAAGQAAGLSVERILNEPTAASLDYGLRHMRDCRHILVYDLGGGTLDVTVLELFEGVVDVKSSCGNNTLGGKDFDQAIINYITAAIKKRGKKDITQDDRAMMRIKIAAEQCKIALSIETQYLMEIPFLYSGKDGEPAGFTETITRAAFQDMIRAMIESTGTQVKTALSDAKLTPEDIDLTLLVGGSTRIPMVSQFLAEQFSFSPETAVDPDLTVVSGAAIQAGVLDGVLNENAIILTDICPYSLSTAALVNFGSFEELYCDVLIKRNTTLPATVSKVYSTSCDHQTKVHITAYQGESEIPEENYLLNCFELSGIPKARAGKEQINICFAYDLNGILVVSSEIVSTGKSATVTVDTATVGKSLDLSDWKTLSSAKQYRAMINKADRLVKLHGDSADEVKAAADELKKALILGWDDSIVKRMSSELQDTIDEFEEGL